MIDSQSDTVMRPGDPHPWVVTQVASHQPEAPVAFHAILARERFGDRTDLRRCVKDGNGWCDAGPAPAPELAGRHPDLPDYLASIIDVARQVCRTLPGCRNVTVFLTYARRTDEDFFISDAMFDRCNPDEPDICTGVFTDQDLDWCPQVRLVERAGISFKDFLEIKGYDDASGYEGEFSLVISPTALHLAHQSPDDEILILSSRFVDGVWQHHTSLDIVKDDDNAVDLLRAERDRQSWLIHRFQSTHWAQSYDTAQPVFLSIEDSEDNSRQIVNMQPGSLIGASSPIQQLAA